MTFSSLSIDKRRRTYVRLIGQIRRALNEALGQEFERRGLTKTKVALLLGWSKSFVTRKLAGTSNMTLETLADLAFALDRIVEIRLIPRTSPPGSNFEIYSDASTSNKPAKISISESDGKKEIEVKRKLVPA